MQRFKVGHVFLSKDRGFYFFQMWQDSLCNSVMKIGRINQKFFCIVLLVRTVAKIASASASIANR